MTPIYFFLWTAATCAVRASGDVERFKSRPSRLRTVDNRHVFNPRMDYDEWKPLGRGDPLKNDPTYDYVPPVLDRVHYWMDPSKRTPDSGMVTLTTKTEPSPTTPPATSRLGTMTLLDPFLKFMDASKATLGYSTSLSSYFRPTPNPSSIYTQPVHPEVYGPPLLQHPPKSQPIQRPPYTMLVPPPLPSSTEILMTSFATSTTSTTDKSNGEFVTLPTPSSTLESTTDPTTATSATTAISQTTILANSENLYKPVAINMPEAISNETNEDNFISKPNEGSVNEILIPNLQEPKNHFVTNIQTPSLVMVPPPQGSDDFYGFRPTTVRTTTTLTTLTTDPMFKHYKQPSEPIRGPFYLIIQGHSKVKTYGASKNKVKAVSSNEINFDDGKIREEDDDLTSSESYRRERKLKLKDLEYFIDDENTDIVQGHPIIELSASYKSKGPTAFSVGENNSEFVNLEDAFPKSAGGSSKKRVLGNHLLNGTSNRRRRFISRKLLATEQSSTKPDKDKDGLDQEQLGLESLIGLSEDYNSEDVINLLLKEEGQGSGLGNFVSSLLGRSIKENDEI